MNKGIDREAEKAQKKKNFSEVSFLWIWATPAVFFLTYPRSVLSHLPT